MEPTDEQQVVIDAAQNTDRNLLVSALAGAAKTTTLVMIANAVDTQMLCLAFNRRIAREMDDRLPDNCTAMTLNSLGHRAWADTIGRRLRIDTSKNYTILRALVDNLSMDDKKEAFETFSDTLHAIAFGKSCGYVPDDYSKRSRRLMDDADFFAHLEVEPTDLQMMLISEASKESLKQAFQGNCDYDDQILMPTVFSSLLPRYPLVLVDEAQDLSALNHALLRKLARQRIIATGDACQSVYGFRGAHEESMELLRESFDMKELMLSISFRCPKAVVREAQWRAPHMRWPEQAEEGLVQRLKQWSSEDLPDEAAIICRNNAPLFAMAIKLLRNRRYPQVVGADIGKSLVRLMHKLGPESMKQEQAKQAVEEWKEARLAKSRDPRKVHDQAACMMVFLGQGRDLGEAIAYAEHLINSSGPIQLITGHKAKGLEWDHVYFLDQHLVKVDKGQDKNLYYVIQTRSRQTLTYVNSEDFVSMEEESGEERHN